MQKRLRICANRLILCAGLFIYASQASAQSLNPSWVEFDPSPDHATNQEYRLTINVVGQSTAVKTISLGKPTPEIDGKIRAPFWPGDLPFLTPGVSYEGRVSAVSASGQAASIASSTFQFTATCPVSVTGSSYAVTPTGGRGSLSLRSVTGCVWKAASDAPWLTMASGGTGDATVVFDATPNAYNGSPRKATLTLGDQSVTVTQAVPACTYDVTALSLPSDAAPRVTGAEVYVWEPVSTDTRALLRTTAGRVKAAWFGQTFSIDATAPVGFTQQLAVYVADFDPSAREEQIDIFDDAGVKLDSQPVKAFSKGRYLVWTIRGHVTLRVTRLAGPNAIVSGVFLGPPVASAGGASAVFVAADDLTAGDWRAVYGRQSAVIAGDVVTPMLSAAGGIGAWTVAAPKGCAWTAIGATSWVTLEDAGGSGAGTVDFTLAANPTAVPRTVTVTIGGQVIQLTQAGMVGPFVAAPVKPRVIR